MAMKRNTRSLSKHGMGISYYLSIDNNDNYTGTVFSAAGHRNSSGIMDSNTDDLPMIVY